jgi:hypothetical protein
MNDQLDTPFLYKYSPQHFVHTYHQFAFFPQTNAIMVVH